jgi:hypothetical protein
MRRKPILQRQAQLVGITPACINRLALGTSEGKKRLHLKVADIEGQLAHPQKCRLPALHRKPPYCSGPMKYQAA